MGPREAANNEAARLNPVVNEIVTQHLVSHFLMASVMFLKEPVVVAQVNDLPRRNLRGMIRNNKPSKPRGITGTEIERGLEVS